MTIIGFWIDPPNYFDEIVWPNHIKYHKHLYSGEKGIRIEDLNILETNHRDSLINNINKSIMIIIDYIKK